MIVRGIAALLMVSSVTGLGLGQRHTFCYAAQTRQVGTADELEQALVQPGELGIYLKADVLVEHALTVRGRKILSGRGRYGIRRRAEGQNTYRGTLLSCHGESLQLKGITVDGGGKIPGAPEQITGRLLRVSSGMVVIDEGTDLSGNYNFSSHHAGGGAVLVERGAAVVMKDGARITDNLTMEGGAGVRVCPGAAFIMEGGMITDNAAVGQSETGDFDGRGGGIYNAGRVIVQGGEIRDNIARACRSAGKRYGGRGDAIYNQGTLGIAGGTVQGGNNAVDNDQGAVRVTGGSVSGKWLGIKNDGTLFMSGEWNVNRIYLAKNRRIKLGKLPKKSSCCELCPAVYETGQVAAAGGEAPGKEGKHLFTLKKKPGFQLRITRTGWYVKRVSRTGRSDGEEGKETTAPTPRTERTDEKEKPTPTPRMEKKGGKEKPEEIIPPEAVPADTVFGEPVSAKAVSVETVSAGGLLPVPYEGFIQTAPVETAFVETEDTREAAIGEVVEVDSAYIEEFSLESVWRLPEYHDLLQRTFQKKREQYEEVWEISQEDRRRMLEFGRRYPEGERGRELLFYKQFSGLRVFVSGEERGGTP